MARVLLAHRAAEVGLLNIGVEEIKGLEEVREAGQYPARGQGAVFSTTRDFVEGDNWPGLVDVVVTEGFTGNVALKAAEGTRAR
jgi:glycerol-3-phosphate acyltransferase PlsX